MQPFTVRLVLMRPILVLTAAVALSLPSGAEPVSAGPPAAERVEIREPDLSDYPRMMVPAVVHSDSEAIRFRLLQDGRPVQGVTVEPLGKRSLSVLLVLDVSGSMKGEPLAQAKRAAARFAQAAKTKDRVGVASFASKVSVAAPFSDDRASTAAAISGLSAKGETAVYDATVKAMRLIGKERSERKAVVLLSDGGDTASRGSLKKAVAAVKGKGVPVYVVALRSPEFDTKALSAIAKASGGRLMSKVDPASLGQVFRGLSRELNGQYQLYFTSSTGREYSWLDLTVRAGGQRLTASRRFTVPRADVAPVPEVEVPVDLTTRIGSAGFMVLGALAAFAAMVMMITSVAAAPRRNVLSSSLDYYYGLRSTSNLEGAPGLNKARGLSGFIKGASRMVGRISGKHGFSEMAAAKLDQAGLPVRPNEFIFMHVTAVVGLGVLAAVMGDTAAAVAVVFAVTVAPIVAVQLLIARRVRKLDEQLPDTLMSLTGLLRAGFGLHQALESTANDTPAPISHELRNVLQQVSFGISLDEALQRMATRVRSKDFDWAVVAVSINRETGGNLAGILQNVADNMRERQGFKRKVDALSAEGKLSGQILSALPFVVAIGFWIINPGYMSRLVFTPVGNVMLIAALGLVGTGILWMRRIVKIEY